MIHHGRVLVPVDGSDASHAAARHAIALAAETDAAVDVLHVVPEEFAAAGGDESADPRDARGRTALTEVESVAEEAGVDVGTAVLVGAPYETILEHAAERGAHLIVMGRHGAGSVGERLLGGVTEKVLRAGVLPVLTAWADAAGETVVDAETLLLPTDGSDCAELAAEHAAALADVSGATVHVVSVADVEAAGGLFDAGGLSAEFVENVESRCQEAVERVATEVEAATGRPPETAVRRGTPAAALRAYVEEAGVDAVVMGAHGRSGFSRWMLGSVTERLLRTTDVPVLVVPGE